jgi:TonB family protein
MTPAAMVRLVYSVLGSLAFHGVLWVGVECWPAPSAQPVVPPPPILEVEAVVASGGQAGGAGGSAELPGAGGERIPREPGSPLTASERSGRSQAPAMVSTTRPVVARRAPSVRPAAPHDAPVVAPPAAAAEGSTLAPESTATVAEAAGSRGPLGTTGGGALGASAGSATGSGSSGAGGGRGAAGGSAGTRVDTACSTADALAIRAAVEARKRYPLLARRRGLEGSVELVVRVAPDGGLAEVQVARSAGEPFDSAALEAVHAAVPLPRCSAPVRIPIRFRLTGGHAIR